MIYCCSLPSGPRLQGATARSCFLCWPQAFKEPSPSPSFQLPLPWGRKRLQNYSFFLYAQAFSQLFFVFFLIFFFGADYQRRANGGFFRPPQRKRPGRPETAPFSGLRLRFLPPGRPSDRPGLPTAHPYGVGFRNRYRFPRHRPWATDRAPRWGLMGRQRPFAAFINNKRNLYI